MHTVLPHMRMRTYLILTVQCVDIGELKCLPLADR